MLFAFLFIELPKLDLLCFQHLAHLSSRIRICSLFFGCGITMHLRFLLVSWIPRGCEEHMWAILELCDHNGDECCEQDLVYKDGICVPSCLRLRGWNVCEKMMCFVSEWFRNEHLNSYVQNASYRVWWPRRLTNGLVHPGGVKNDSNGGF